MTFVREQPPVRRWWQRRASRWSLDRVPHLIRFGISGGLATGTQMIVLVALVSLSLDKSVAHAIALAISSQVSFFLSRDLTWAERRRGDESIATVLGKLGRFNVMIAASMLVNQVTFQVAALHVHYLIAAAIGILVAAIINFTVSDRLIFAAATERKSVPASSGSSRRIVR